MNDIKDFVVGEYVYVLEEYHFTRYKVVKVGRTRLQVQITPTYTKSVELHRVAKGDDMVIVVWELWKGKNGRGAYRIEREHHKEYLRPAKLIQSGFRGLLWEDQYLVVSKGNSISPYNGII